MPWCKGFCGPGFTKYAPRMARTMMSGLSHVCLNEMVFHLRKRDFALRRLECGLANFSLGSRSSCEEVGGVSRRWEVERAGAPVSPRGSPPRLLPPRGRPIVATGKDVGRCRDLWKYTGSSRLLGSTRCAVCGADRRLLPTLEKRIRGRYKHYKAMLVVCTSIQRRSLGNIESLWTGGHSSAGHDFWTCNRRSV